MKFYDIDDLAKKYGGGNKYLATSLVAERACRLSAESSAIDPEGEKYLSEALSEFELGLLGADGEKIVPVQEMQEEKTAEAA